MADYSKTSPTTLRLIIKASEGGVRRIDKYFSQGIVTSRQHLAEIQLLFKERDSAIAGLQAQGEPIEL